MKKTKKVQDIELTSEEQESIKKILHDEFSNGLLELGTFSIVAAAIYVCAKMQLALPSVLIYDLYMIYVASAVFACAKVVHLIALRVSYAFMERGSAKFCVCTVPKFCLNEKFGNLRHKQFVLLRCGIIRIALRVE